MKIRKITSLTALLSFLTLISTSTILYIAPHGRIAYWSDWRLWGMTKTEWGNIHINIGVLFLITIFLHIYYNWKPILSYLKNKSKQLKIFTKDFNAAIIITIFFAVGTYFEMPPLIWILDISESIKDSAAQKYGEPPYGHAELSTLKIFTSKMGIDLEKSLEQLRINGIKYENEKQTLQDVSKLNKITPQQIYLAMQHPKDKNVL